jgi:integrase
MAKQPNPWFWEARNLWCVKIRGERTILGPHPDGEPPPKKSKKTGRWNPPQSILDAFHRLMRGEPVTAEQAEEAADSDRVIAVLDDFITWAKENKAALTAKRYEQFCQGFVRHEVDGVKIGNLPVAKLTSRHVTAWLNAQEDWNSTTKRNAITALQAALNWAVLNRGLDRNPIRGMKKPEAQRRTDILTAVEFEDLLEVVGDGCFRDLLIVSYDCGARPFEVKDLERRHLDFEKRCAVIPADEAKGRKRTRTVYFPTDRSMAIIRRLAEAYLEGPIFRNTMGNQWTSDAVKCRFEDIEIAFGLAEMKRQGIELDTSEESIQAVAKTLSPTRKNKKTGVETPKKTWELRKEARQKLIAQQAQQYGKRFNHYAFRRTFITRKIIAGVDSHVVAKLAGHQSTAMIDKHYSQVASDHEFMLQQAMRDIEPKG